MKRAAFLTILAVMVMGAGLAKADEASYTGVTWGFVRTYWSTQVNDEGYPRAGTAGPMIALRRVRRVSDHLSVTPYLQYFGMRSSVTTLVCDTCGTMTQRTYFREIDLGINLQLHPVDQWKSFYIGGGPSIRWGQAGRRERFEPRPGDTYKGTWFGLTALAGIERKMQDRAVVFFEPQLMFSPDFADRWQTNYPPVNLILQMGVLWR